MKRILVVIILLYLINEACAQGYESLMVAGAKQTKSELQDIVKNLSDQDTTSFTIKKMNWYHHLLSSAYAWLGEMDNAEVHWFRALELDPTFMCHFTRMNLMRDIPESQFLLSVPKDSYFAFHFGEEAKTRFFTKCDSCCNGGIKEKQIDTLTYNSTDSVLLELLEDDQKYRGPNYISKNQEKIDVKNRNVLDSIYNQIGFPNKFKVNKKSVETVWLIIHHSTDCEWAGKWLSSALYEIENGNMKMGFYGETIERFYNKTDGYCHGHENKFGANKLIQQVLKRSRSR